MNAAERRRFRALVRATHPDTGGDHESFVSAMARWSEADSAAGVPANVRFHHRSTPFEQVVDGVRTLIHYPARKRRTS